MPGVLLLFSGGADSVLLLKWLVRRKDPCGLLMINYGQRHVEELDFADRFLADLPMGERDSISRFVVNLSEAFTLVRAPLLCGGGPTYKGVNPNYVPSRNLVFVSVALSIAESYGYEEVWYGADFSDREDGFPDCFQEWVVLVDRIARINGSRPIPVRAPLLGFTKRMVEENLRVGGVDPAMVYSGYGPPQKEVR